MKKTCVRCKKGFTDRTKRGHRTLCGPCHTFNCFRYDFRDEDKFDFYPRKKHDSMKSPYFGVWDFEEQNRLREDW
jgi:hypothetical protein